MWISKRRLEENEKRVRGLESKAALLAANLDVLAKALMKRPLPLSSQTRAARRGLPLAERIDLRDDPVAIPPVGPSRPARVIRVGRK